MWLVGSAVNVIFYSKKVLNKKRCPSESFPVPFVQAGIRPPSLSSVKSHVLAVLNLKDAGLAALKDITHLSGRKPDDRDLTDLMYSRVSLNSLLLKEFKALSNRGQQAYIYRIAA